MNEIQTFYFKNKEIKIKVIDNEPCFNLEDVCKILDIKDPWKAKRKLDRFGVKTENFISEPNLYILILQSHRRENIEFAVWVTSEVLPVFIQKKVVKKLIKNLKELRDEDLEKLIERNGLK